MPKEWDAMAQFQQQPDLLAPGRGGFVGMMPASGSMDSALANIRSSFASAVSSTTTPLFSIKDLYLSWDWYPWVHWLMQRKLRSRVLGFTGGWKRMLLPHITRRQLPPYRSWLMNRLAESILEISGWGPVYRTEINIDLSEAFKIRDIHSAAWKGHPDPKYAWRNACFNSLEVIFELIRRHVSARLRLQNRLSWKVECKRLKALKLQWKCNTEQASSAAANTDRRECLQNSSPSFYDKPDGPKSPHPWSQCSQE